MTLWDQLQSLQGQAQAQISELLMKYPLELEVQYHLAAWLEIQPWGEAADSSSEDQVKMAKELLENLINTLKKQATPVNRPLHEMLTVNKLNQLALNIEMKYQNNPTGFAELMHQLLVAEHQIIMSQQQLIDDMEGTEDISQQATQQSAVIADLLAQQLNDKEMEQVVKNLEQEKENYVIQFEDIRSKIVVLENKHKDIDGNMSLSQNSKEEGLKRCKSDMEKMWSAVKQKAEGLLGQRNEAIEKLKLQLQKFKEFQQNILGEVVTWQYSQKLAHCGFQEPEPLDDIKKHCEALAELEWRGYTHTTQVENLFLQVLQNNKAELNRMTEIKNAYKSLLTKLIEGAFVIEKQPPQVLKTQTKFTSTVRHLIGNKLNMQMSKPEVTATIITERQANELVSTGKWKSQGQDEILNNKKVMEFVPEVDCVVAEFKNMSLKKVNRQGKKNTERVMDEKSTLLFEAQLHIGSEKFIVKQLSLPVSVIVHGNQQPEAEGTIFWDNAFSDIERMPFEVRDKVTWQEFTVALNARWAMANVMHLNESHIDYLASKLYGARSLEGYDNHVMKKESFNKDNLPDRTFTFWIWFYNIMDLVKKHMLQEWQDGLIVGFISKETARDMLLQNNAGTFLLRFSDGILGGISVSYVVFDQGSLDVRNIEPWSYKDLGKRSLSDRIKDLVELRYLFPNRPKDSAFGSFYSKTELNSQVPNLDDYIRSNLACQLSTMPSGVSIGSPGPIDSPDSQMEPCSPMANEMLSSDLMNGCVEPTDSTFDFSSMILPQVDATLSVMDFNLIEQILGNFSSVQVMDTPAESHSDQPQI